MREAKTIGACHSAFDLSASQLDHQVWGNAQPVNIARFWSGEEAPAGRHAEVRILWSEQALCVHYACNQTEPLNVSSNPQTDMKTIGLWDFDVCEIFLAPDQNAPERYFEFEAAPTGEWLDLGIHFTAGKRETDWEFHSGMTVATRVETDRVVIAMKIPWGSAIPKPRRGERWRANLFRCVGSGDTRGYLAWQPTLTPEPSFHVPQSFGWLRFD